MVQFEPFVILCRKVIKRWSLPTTNHIIKICSIVQSISSQVIEKECNKILVDYFLERMIEYIDSEQKKIHLDAAEIFDDELTPLTCQEFDFPNVGSVSTPVPPSPAVWQLREEPTPLSCQEYDFPTLESASKPTHHFLAARQPPEPFQASAQKAEPVEEPVNDPESEETTISDSSDLLAPVGRRPTKVDSAGDARMRRFVKEYCKAAATRYVDAICLYVIERRLFKKCDVRVNDWFMEDKSALARVQESAQTSSWRAILPAKIENLSQALAILEK
jgi:hypothetical protein